MHRLYTNSTPFYIRDLSTVKFWYLRGVLELKSYGYHGTTVLLPTVRNKRCKINPPGRMSRLERKDFIESIDMGIR